MHPKKLFKRNTHRGYTKYQPYHKQLGKFYKFTLKFTTNEIVYLAIAVKTNRVYGFQTISSDDSKIKVGDIYHCLNHEDVERI